ncbi:mite allergen Der p 3 [Drosophila rhopaloa]|uniref:Mite allergen Der p 3 n=1 Tax=Drosophila rhopaloa TaxID=1041015 RepID=A0A6P4FK74_DRORH|nr:mite allergen Der p 3 [Drosophila rhopaloa]
MGQILLELTICTGLLILSAGIEGRQKDPSWSGYYRDNGAHHLLNERPKFTHQNFLPFGNISSNPFISALESQDDFHTRIVNGERIPCEEAPFQGSLHYKGYFVCGCVIISRLWVMTAHHCYFGPHQNYQVRVATDQHRRFGQLRDVSRIVALADYDDYTMQHDLALIKLKSPLFYDKCVQQVKLPSPNTKRFPRKFAVSGWGITSVNAQNAQPYLRRVELDFMRREKCQQKYKKVGIKIYKHMICASRTRKDSCSGDSGGPLTRHGILYGIVSWGIGCANRNYPGVFVNCKRYIPWIKRVLKKY